MAAASQIVTGAVGPGPVVSPQPGMQIPVVALADFYGNSAGMPQGLSVSDGNSRLNPTSGATIVSIAASGLATSGLWRVNVWAGYSGTLGSAEQTTAGGNFLMFVGNTQIGTQSNGFFAVTPYVGPLQGPFTWIIRLDGQSSLSMTASQTATTGATYWGLIIADLLVKGG